MPAKSQQKVKPPRIKTKVVIRNLPHNLPEKEFFELISKYKTKINWSNYIPGQSTSLYVRPSIAFLNFTNVEDLYEFAKEFDGHILITKKGKKHKISVEFAPFQKISDNQIGSDDPRRGTILKDENYLKFLEQLEKPPEKILSAEKQLELQEDEERKISKTIIIEIYLQLY